MTEKGGIVAPNTENAKISNTTGVDITLNVWAQGYGTKTWRNLRQRARRNGWPLLKQVMVDAIKKKIREDGIVHRNYSDGVLVIDLAPCGGHATYMTWADIPDHDVSCPCGDPTHWLIRYHDLR